MMDLYLKVNEENVSDDKEKAIDELLSDESNNVNEIPISNEDDVIDLNDNE